MNQVQSEWTNWNETPRIQKGGWNYGKKSELKKRSMNFRKPVGLKMEQVSKETGKNITEVVNDVLERYWGFF